MLKKNPYKVFLLLTFENFDDSIFEIRHCIVSGANKCHKQNFIKEENCFIPHYLHYNKTENTNKDVYSLQFKNAKIKNNFCDNNLRIQI